jgi:hypothetical protein
VRHVVCDRGAIPEMPPQRGVISALRSWAGAGWLITNASLTTCSPSGQKQLPGLFEHLSAAASAVVGGDVVIADHQREGQNATGFDLVQV